jgi:hypothetical protein
MTDTKTFVLQIDEFKMTLTISIQDMMIAVSSNPKQVPPQYRAQYEQWSREVVAPGIEAWLPPELRLLLAIYGASLTNMLDGGAQDKDNDSHE